MEIKIKDYLSDSQIEKIVEEELRENIREKIRERNVLSNLPYKIVLPLIQELVTEDELNKLRETIVKLLNEESSIKYLLFKEPDVWESKKTIKVSNVIQDTIEKNLDIVKQKTINSLNNIDEDKMTEYLQENSSELICVLLSKFGK